MSDAGGSSLVLAGQLMSAWLQSALSTGHSHLAQKERENQLGVENMSVGYSLILRVTHKSLGMRLVSNIYLQNCISWTVLRAASQCFPSIEHCLQKKTYGEI